jgi:hypothetical protein
VIVPTSVPELSDALRLYATHPARRFADGRAARLLIEQCYNWDIIARQVEQMYAGALRRRAEPEAPREHSDATGR